MTIYTSYFGNWRNYPGMITHSIALYPPKGYSGDVIKELAPDPDSFKNYKSTHDEIELIKAYQIKLIMLGDRILDLVEEGHIYLCYEVIKDPTKFYCHRQILASYLKSKGIDVKEL